MKTITSFKHLQERTWSLILYVFIFLFSGLTYAQTLKTDNDVPALSACGDYEEFTLRIGYGANACPGATLEIVMPDHFLYEVGSAKLGGNPIAETTATEAGASIALSIPAGVPTQELVITFNAKATCEAIATANLPIDQRPSVTYNLSGCGGATLTGDSEAINIRFAILTITVNPSEPSGVIGDEVTRTITIRNSGTGYINGFTIEETLATSLSLVSITQNDEDDWTITNLPLGGYVFSGHTLAAGETISFTEVLTIDDCSNLQTNFEAYYGCTDKCTVSNVNAEITSGVVIDNSIQPNLVFQGVTVPTVTCFNREYEYVYRVRNTGTGDAGAIELHLNTDGGTGASTIHGYGSTYFVGGSFELSETSDFSTVITPGLGETRLWLNANGQHFGTTDEISWQTLELPPIEAGGEIYVRFKMYHAAPLESLSCAAAPNRVLFGSLVRGMTYKHANHCEGVDNAPLMTMARASIIAARDYHLTGFNSGQVDIVEGQPYMGEYSFTNLYLSTVGFSTGDYVDIVLELSPSMAGSVTESDIVLLLSGDNITPNVISEGAGVFRLRFPYGTAPFTSAGFNLTGSLLRFNTVMDCAGGAPWYRVSTELYMGSDCDPDSTIKFGCNTVNLSPKCGTGPCPEGGLSRGSATLKRITYGDVAETPDSNGIPKLPLEAIDIDDLPAGVRATAYTVGDIVEISQEGISIVTDLSPVGPTGWTAGRFSFPIPANHVPEGINNGGKVVVTRGGTEYVFEGLATNVTSTMATLTFTIADLHAVRPDLAGVITGFINDDKVVSSIQFRVMGFSMANGASEFATTYTFTHGGTDYSCNHNFTATGISGVITSSFGNYYGSEFRDLANCDTRPHFTRFLHHYFGNATRNGLYLNEYRQSMFPKKAIFNVPSGLELVSIDVWLGSQGVGSNGNILVTLPSPVTNDSAYEFDVEEALNTLFGGTYYLDEGYDLRLYPTVIPTCTAGQQETVQVKMIFDGTTRMTVNGTATNFYNATDIETTTVNLNYNTGVGSLNAVVAQPITQAKTTHAEWIIQVTNSSNFRRYDNVWVGKSGGSSEISSIQQVTGFTDLTPIGAPITDGNGDGIFELGNFTVGATATTGNRYYLISAPISGCETGDLQISYGQKCGEYPTDVVGAECTLGALDLSYTQVFAQLQTVITSQNPANARPLLCEELPYTITVNNGGQGTAYGLGISIPLTAAEGLIYVPGSLEVTDAYTGAVVPGFVSLDDSNVVVAGGLFPAINIIVPTGIAGAPETLAFGERFQVRVRLKSDGCEFRSGQRIGFYPAGINACGTRVANTSGVASNRVTIDGAPDTEPTLLINTETANINIAENEGDPLTALYNFQFTNEGDGVNDFAVDTTYGFNIKLPANWEFVDPHSLVDPALLSYVGFDPAKGYVYEFISNLTVGNSVTITDALMNYTGDISLLNCEEDLGTVVATIYTVFTPNMDPSCSGACDIEQVILTSEVPISLPFIPTPTTDDLEQEFCETENATIADIQINEPDALLNWYDVETGGTPLTPTTVLATGTYYIYVAMVDGATGCESEERLQIEVTISAAVTANAGINQTVLNGSTFTLNGNQPTAPATGEWSVVSATGTDMANVVITDASVYNTTVQIPVGSSATLQWTLTNGSCTDFSQVVITSEPNGINAEDDDFSSTYINNEDGNPNVGNVLPDNGAGADTLGTDDATLSTVTISVVTEANPVTPGANVPELDPVTGIVSVPADTPSGTYYITYRICETALLPAVENCDTAVVTVVVVDANKTVAIDDINNTYINTPVGGSVATNDFDPEGHTQSWTPMIVTTDGHLLILNANGTYTFTPATDFTGTVVYEYTVCDNGIPQACDTANLTIEVLPLPVAGDNTVTANNDTATTEENQPVDINVISNDFDMEGDNFEVTTNTDPSNGTVVNNGDGTFTYTPNPGFTGVDTFEYTICDDGTPQACDTAIVTITVLPDNGTNDTVANDDAYNGTVNTPITGNVIDNDFDPEDHTQVVTTYTQPSNGTVVVNNNGTFIYTPNENYSGPDQFVYTICDNGTPMACDTATVYITINCALTLEIEAEDELVECSADSEQAYLDWLDANGNADVNDVCSAATWSYVVDDTIDNCGNTSVRTVTFTATNLIGQSVSTTATFTIVDTTAPAFNETLPVDVTVECNAVPLAVVLTATDNCDADVDVVYEEVRTDGSCPNTYILTRTWTVEDACENETVHTQTIIVQDTTAPAFNETLPADVTVECNAVPDAVVLTATDNCDVTADVVYEEVRTDGSCPNTYVLTRTWTVEDECENVNVHTQIITVQDTTAPAFNETLPADVTVECNAVPDAVVLTATDNCDVTVDVVYEEVRTDGSCPNTYVLTRTWTVEDECENVNVHTQIITVQDTTKPVFDVAPADVTVECDGLGNLVELQAWLDSNGNVGEATDNCGDVTWSYLLEDTNTICGLAGTHTYTFIITDECGNWDFRQATFTIVDTTAPDVTDASDITVECDGQGNIGDLNAWLNNNGGATATDDCSTQLVWTNNFNGLTGDCERSAEVIFTVTDECGNLSTTTATFTIVDTTDPVLDLSAQNLTVSCASVNIEESLNNWLLTRGGATVIDACSDVVWTNNFTELTDGCGSTGSAEVIFTATDACGNFVTTTATFTIVDTTSPVIVNPAQNLTVECDGEGNTDELTTWLLNNGGATATDLCGDVTWTNNYSELVSSCGETGSVLVVFTATDECGNFINTAAIFTIVDTTAPVVTSAVNETVECDGNGNISQYEAWLLNNGGATATDSCGDITWSYTVEDTNTHCGQTGMRTINFTATDSCGNFTTVQGTFTIIDTEAPSMDVFAQNLTVECDGQGNIGDLNAWLNNNGGATATDDCSTQLVWTNDFNGLTGDCVRSAEVTFTVTDECGNFSTTTATFTIVDTTAPVLDLSAQNLTVSCAAVSIEESLNNWLLTRGGATVIDSCSDVVWTNNFTELTDGCGSTGSAEVIFTATDACGNFVTTTAIFTIVDTTSPVIVNPAQSLTVECDGEGNTDELTTWLENNGGATATDLCGDVTWTNNYSALVSSCGETGSVLVVFTATDECGNFINTAATFTIIDTTAPVVTAALNETVQCDGNGNISQYEAWLLNNGGATATDSCGDITWSYTVEDTDTHCGQTGMRTINFTATDSCGNFTTVQGTFTIIDTEAPSMDVFAQNLTVECDGNGNVNDLYGWLNSNGGASASDACSTTITWSNNFDGLSEGCVRSAEVTFTVVDACGNESSTTAVFTIVDTTPPVFTSTLPQDMVIECTDPVPSVAVLTASDLCGSATVSYIEERLEGGCANEYVLIRTWTATDSCGNSTDHVQVITIVDTTAPVFVGTLPQNGIFVNCENLEVAPTLEAVDSCGSVEVYFTEEQIEGDCESRYILIRTWTAIDACGNETVYTQHINLLCKLEVYNGVSANGDGINDIFYIKGIDCYPDNKVQIFNRWGVKVYEEYGYNNADKVWDGISTGRTTYRQSGELPVGTYFYFIEYTDAEGRRVKQDGHLYLTR